VMRLRRPGFRDVAERQLRMFAEEHAALIRDCEDALRAYDGAAAAEAEERYAAFLELAEEGRELLEELRDGYAGTLGDPDRAEAYRAAFADLARRRLPRFALELD
jgi:hypothetical protein